MNRRTLPIATALTTAAFLLLTACGSDDEPGANDKIAGVDSGGPKSASPSALPENDVKRPDIQLPGDIKDSFEDWKSSDPTKDAVLTDAAEAMTATNYAITQGIRTSRLWPSTTGAMRWWEPPTGSRRSSTPDSPTRERSATTTPNSRCSIRNPEDSSSVLMSPRLSAKPEDRENQ